MQGDEDFSVQPRKTSGLLERDAEVAILRARLDGAANGRGAMTAVIGPAGIGKSSLLAVARGHAAENGFLTLAARGGELERDYGFGIARQLFERPVAELPAARRRAVLGGAAARAAPAVGLEAQPGAELEESYAVLHGLYWLAANLSQRCPCLLLVDDLHWSDAASLRFLAYLRLRLDSHPIAVVVASRPAIESPDPLALEQVIGAPEVAHLTPSSLSPQAVGALLEAVLEDAHDDVVRSVFASTGGNPFLCRLAAAGIAEGRNLTTDSSAALITRRIGSLDEPSAALARAVAVLGTNVAPTRAAALAGLEIPAAMAAADGLARRGVFAPGPVLEFTHPLVRAAVREGIAPLERGRLHARAAELLRAGSASEELVAVHLLSAPPDSVPRSAETLHAGARAASSKGDPATAAAYLRRALVEPLPVEQRAAIELELGEVELRGGDPHRAIEHLEPARSAVQGVEQRLRATRLLALARMSTGDFEPAVDLLRAAADEASPGDPELAMMLEGELFQCGMMLPATYQEVTARLATKSPEVDGHTPGERSLLTAFATSACIRGESAERVRELAQRAFDRGLLQDRGPYSVVWTNAAYPLVFAEGFAVAAPIVRAAMQGAVQDADPLRFVRALTVSAMLRMKQGDMREAESDARRAVELGREIATPAALLASWPLAEALVERGGTQGPDQVLAVPAEADRITFMAGWAAIARARLQLLHRRTHQAVAELRKLQEREAGWNAWNPAMFPYRSMLALALWRKGDIEEARTVAASELELSRRWGAPGALAASLRTLGLVSGDLEMLQQSAAIAEGSGAELEHARSLYELGSATRRDGRRSQAREPLYAAMEKAHRCGATVLAARAREELVINRRPPAPPRPHRRRRAHPERAPRRPDGGRRDDEPRDRAGAVRHAPDRPSPPHQQLSKAGHRVTEKARSSTGGTTTRLAPVPRERRPDSRELSSDRTALSAGPDHAPAA